MTRRARLPLCFHNEHILIASDNCKILFDGAVSRLQLNAATAGISIIPPVKSQQRRSVYFEKIKRKKQQQQHRNFWEEIEFLTANMVEIKFESSI